MGSTHLVGNITINNTNLNLSYLIIIGFAVSLVVFCLVLEFSIKEISAITSESDTKSNTPIKHVIVISQGRRTFDITFEPSPERMVYHQNIQFPLIHFLLLSRNSPWPSCFMPAIPSWTRQFLFTKVGVVG